MQQSGDRIRRRLIRVNVFRRKQIQRLSAELFCLYSPCSRCPDRGATARRRSELDVDGMASEEIESDGSGGGCGGLSGFVDFVY